MAPLIHLVVAAFVGSVFAALRPECLLACGESNYDPSQYTCFEDGTLCPINNGDRYLRCGDACYSTSLYTCSNTTLKPLSHSGVESLEDCGSSTFYPSQHVCLEGEFLCPFVNEAATLRCDSSCFNPSQFYCDNGLQSPVGAPPMNCISAFGIDHECNGQDCRLLPCCPCLVHFEGSCRDPCQLDPSSCLE
ncbi:carbohydrate binding-domain-containing protein [Mycena olivaceomarginata]|nr:carbohydrate binding-domain-containing protein [Mycena olivaceomarginata]